MPNHISVSSLPGVRQIEALYGFFEDVGEKLKEVTSLLGGVIATPASTVSVARGEGGRNEERHRLRALVRSHGHFLNKQQRAKVDSMWANGQLVEAADAARELSSASRMAARKSKPSRRTLGIAYRRMSPAKRVLKMKFMHLMQGLPAATRSKLRALRAEKGYAAAVKVAKRAHK